MGKTKFQLPEYPRSCLKAMSVEEEEEEREKEWKSVLTMVIWRTPGPILINWISSNLGPSIPVQIDHINLMKTSISLLSVIRLTDKYKFQLLSTQLAKQLKANQRCEIKVNSADTHYFIGSYIFLNKCFFYYL